MSKTIELIKSEIYEAKSNLLKFTELLKEEPKREGYSFYVTFFTNRLNILEQIKCELEAWEVVQGTIVEGEDRDGHYCYIETVYFTGEKGEKVKKGLYNDATR